MKKLTLLTALIYASMFSFAAPVASGELFATYQKHGDIFYEGGNQEANVEATAHNWAIDYYIVSCGDSMLLRATTTEERNLNAGWQTQLRVWTGAYNNGNEIQTNAGGGTKNCYTSVCRKITPAAEDLKIHLFVDWSGYCVTQTFDFNRASINNPTTDNVAPVIDPAEVTMEEVDGVLVFTFGTVTADDEYFYYVGDKEHHVGSISLANKVYVLKPTVEDGTTYTFKCYAVDYNGNKSAYKEFTVSMPFDSNLDLAADKSCTAGYYNGGDVPGNAVNGKNNHWGTYGISDYTQNWWQVDLNNAYKLSEIDVELEFANTYKIEGSLDGSNWTEIIRTESAPSANVLVEYKDLTVSARYLKLTALEEKMISIRHFKVYGTGLAEQISTDVEQAVNKPQVQRVLRDGQIYIIRDGEMYDVQGSRIR